MLLFLAQLSFKCQKVCIVLYCILSDIFTALYQGNAGVSGMASNTSPVSGMMHMNMGMSGITQQPAQQSAAPAGNT